LGIGEEVMSAPVSIQQVINLLKNAKRTGSNWTALCPAHDDHRNSLCVGTGRDGRLLLYCHAGCSFEAISAALGLEPNSAAKNIASLHAQSPTRRIVASYDYTDEQGNLLFQVCRTEPKSFFQRRPDGAGGYIYGLNGARRVLYGLPELLEADPAVTVFVVEGEKDADALRERGLIATCNPCGAGKWSDEYSEALRGRHVALLPDNDNPGCAHAEKVALSLLGCAASVRVVSLPELPEKGDVSDWIACGNTLERLYELVERAPVWTPAPQLATDEPVKTPPDDMDVPLMRSFKEFMAVRFETVERIAFELRRRELGMLAAVTNRGKSTLIRNALLALATGGALSPIVERGAPRRVLLLDFETSAARLQSDLALMTRDWTTSELALLDENFHVVCEAMMGEELLSLSLHMEVIEREARARQVDFVVVDTLSAGFDLYDENSNGEVSRRVIKPLLRLARSLDASVLIAHHVGKVKSEDGGGGEKAYRARGASSFGCGVTTVFNLTGDAADPDRVTLTCAKRKDGAEYERVLRLDRVARWYRVSEEQPARPPTNYELVVEAVRAFARPMKRAEVIEKLHGRVTIRTIERSLTDAVESGDLTRDGRGGYCAPDFRQSEFEDEPHGDDSSFVDYNF
jgi:hypothetical protein